MIKMEMKVNSSSGNYVSDTSRYTKKKSSRRTTAKPTYTAQKSKGYILELSSEGVYRSQIDRSYKKTNIAELGKKVLKKLTLPKALTAKMKRAIEAYSYQMAYSKRKERRADIYE